MPDSPSNPGGGRPARPAIPPFRGPAAGGARGGAAQPAVPPARGPLAPGNRTATPGGLPPRPAVSPLPPTASRPASRPATPARSPYVTPSTAPAPVVRHAALTPVLAQPEVLPLPVGEIIPNVAASSSGPLAGLDIIEAAPVAETVESPPAPAATQSTGGTDWLSPEGALGAEFGDLVDSIPRRHSAQAPVFPTPPAPWPAIATSVGTPTSGDPTAGESSTGADLDAGFEEVFGTTARPDAAVPAGAPPQAEHGVELEAWAPAADGGATDFEAAQTPDAHETSAGDPTAWAESYGEQADAIHGEMEPAAPESTSAESSAAHAMPAADPASYLASEWPEPAADPSTLPTPVMPGPAVLPGWDAARMPVAPVPPDPLLEAARHEDEDAFGWGRTPQETPPPGSAVGGIGAGDTARGTGGVDDWAFAADDPDSGRGGPPEVTASSLAAAEALERVAVQLREGTLRADGFSPALGEAAALSAVLAALLGVDARWDVQR